MLKLRRWAPLMLLGLMAVAILIAHPLDPPIPPVF
jgi:hypothetical protein